MDPKKKAKTPLTKEDLEKFENFEKRKLVAKL
jgi:hypothetical protein